MNLIKNIFISIFSFLFIIFILEISLRLMGNQPRINDLARKDDPIIYKNDTELGWIHKPGIYNFQPWSDHGKTTKFSINQDGSRKTSNQHNNNLNFIFIGGSLTQGWAVDDDENFVSFFKKLNPELNIINYGVGGYGGFQSLLLQERIIKNFKNINHFIYGFIDHHEVRNVAAGSWLYMLNKYSSRGHVSVPFASIDTSGRLKRNKPISYLKLSLSEYLVLIAKIEKKVMKLKSSKREKNQFKISKMIISQMNKNAKVNNSKFTLLFLDINKKNLSRYTSFLNKNQISFVYCPIPPDEIVQGEGHPNAYGHKIVADCLNEKL